MTTGAAFDRNRRTFLRSLAGGSLLFPGLVSQLLAEDSASTSDPLAPKRPHHAPKAKRVIFLYMSGGVSHIDSWDHRPKLFADAGKTVAVNEFQGRKGSFNGSSRGTVSPARRSAIFSRTWPSVWTTCA